MNDIDFDTPNDGQLRETAADEDCHYFQGKPLHPFSWRRKGALPRLSDDGTTVRDNAILIVFLCVCEIDLIRATRSKEGQAAFFDAMDAWAEENNVGVLKDNAVALEIERIADEIWAEMRASEFEIKPTADQKTKGSASPNG